MLASGNAFRLCVLFRTPVYVTGSYLFLLLFLSFGFLNTGHFDLAFLYAFAITASLLVHEFGHVLAAKWNGHSSRVVFVALGAVTIPSGGCDGWRGIRLSLAGPAAGFLLAVILYYGFPVPMAEGENLLTYSVGFPALEGGNLWPFLHWCLVRIGVIWTIFNLLPILPLDGGQALRDFLGLFMRKYKAEYYAAAVGFGVAVAVGFWAFSKLGVMAALLLGFLAWQNLESMTRKR